MKEGSPSFIKTKQEKSECMYVECTSKKFTVALQFIIAIDDIQKDGKVRMRHNTGNILFADDLVIWEGNDDKIQQ